MRILDIRNRTENWKTAYHFAPFFRDSDARLRLAKKLLAHHLGEQANDVDLEEGNLHINLFWKGMRDHLYRPRRKPEKIILNCNIIKELAGLYTNLFPNLRKEIVDSGLFRDLRDSNYSVSSDEQKSKLASNLYGTEIDIVLASKDYLFVGEAKAETALTGKGDLCLVHQLIRQYVTARILVCLITCASEVEIIPKTVIPFVVRKGSGGREQAQIDFMDEQRWMSKQNVLNWECIDRLAKRP